jgi:hypothetical protein
MEEAMRKILALTLASPFLCSAAFAQNSDLALLAGISGPRGETTRNGATSSSSGSVTPSFQVNYAWQVRQRAVDLYVELPVVVPVRVNGTVVSGPGGIAATGNASPDVFFTPGIRVKFSPESRVSFYGAAGFGIASFAATPSIVVVTAGAVSATVTPGSRRNSPALGFGGGIDIRLTRLLSLRGDVRDFVTEAALGDVNGRNHGIFQFGIAFHF